MQNYDLHMHTTYCDGNNSPEEMVLAALDMGLETVGLSGHSYTWFDDSYCMSRDGMREYVNEVSRLREKYAGRIRVLTGIELDYHSEIDAAPFEYLIGSSHYIFTDGVYCDVDYSAAKFVDEARKHFGGDTVAACETYYEQVGDIVRKTECDIIGHLDLVTKFNELYGINANGKAVRRPAEDGSEAQIRDTYEVPEENAAVMSDEPDISDELDDAEGNSSEVSNAADDLRPIVATDDPRYIAAWKRAIDRIFADTARLRQSKPNRLETLGILTAGDKPVFEINMGAMSKGYRTSPYPSPEQIEYIRSKGGIMIYGSDSHFADTIGYMFR